MLCGPGLILFFILNKMTRIRPGAPLFRFSTELVHSKMTCTRATSESSCLASNFIIISKFLDLFPVSCPCYPSHIASDIEQQRRNKIYSWLSATIRKNSRKKKKKKKRNLSLSLLRVLVIKKNLFLDWFMCLHTVFSQPQKRQGEKRNK